MNKHVVITLAAVMAFLGTGWGVLGERYEHARLIGGQEHRMARLAVSAQDSTNQATAPADQAAPGEVAAGAAVASEVLRLRSEVSRLSARQRELAGVRAENDRLRQGEAN